MVEILTAPIQVICVYVATNIVEVDVLQKEPGKPAAPAAPIQDFNRTVPLRHEITANFGNDFVVGVSGTIEGGSTQFAVDTTNSICIRRWKISIGSQGILIDNRFRRF